MKLHQLLENRNKVVADLRLLQERADARTENTGVLTSDEEAQWAAMQADVVALTAQIERAQFLETEERVGRASHYEVPPSQRQSAAPTRDEQRDNLRHFLRTGEVRAAQSTTDGAGGYLIPDDVSREILQAADEAQVLTPRARIINTMAGTLSLPVASRGSAAWVTEGSSETEGPETFTSVTLSPYKIKAVIPATEEVLQDAGQLEAFINSELPMMIGIAAETAYIAGTGSGQPTGLMGGATVGKTSASATAITFDEVLDLYGALKAAYLPNASWVMNPATAVYLLKIKTGVSSDNRFIWTSDLSASAPGILMGRPVYLSSNVDTIAATKKVIAFGDLSKYAIARRPTLSIQRDPYSQAAKGWVMFRLFQRVDGKLTIAEAVQVMQQHA